MGKIDKNHFRGCLLGGSVGDAIGKISVNDGEFLISDNTQLTAFTVDALIWADDIIKKKEKKSYVPCLFYSYQKWYYTQTHNLTDDNYDFILTGKDLKERILSWDLLYARRGEGTTTMEALKKSVDNNFGTIDKRLNNSTGCGAVMRSAPIGMYFCNNEDDAFKFAIEGACLTHGSDEAIITSGIFAFVIAKIFQGLETKKALQVAIDKAVNNEFGLDVKNVCAMLSKLLSENITKGDDKEVLKNIGKGETAAEVLAISLYIAIKCQNNFSEATKLVQEFDGVNLDSIGSITGNLIGANIGSLDLPFDLIYKTELSDLMVQGADRLLEKVLDGSEI